MSDVQEPSIHPELKKLIDNMYEVYFKKTSRSNVFGFIQHYRLEHGIKEDWKKIKGYIKFHRIGIPDYIFWKYDSSQTFDYSMDNDDE